MNFCAYFDSNYLKKGLVCYQTLNGFLGEKLNFYVICFDKKTIETMSQFNNVKIITMEDIEEYYPALLTIKNTRIPKEYFATMSPILPMYIFDKFFCETLFYTDADIAFWSNPEELNDILGDKSLMVTDHGFEPPRAGIRFNVGILGYRNDKNCREFLGWWADRCIEWCYWTTTPDGKCGDQGYLNILHDNPNMFKNHFSCPHPGVNIGPWNVIKHTYLNNGEGPKVDGEYNLICYHYHEFELTGESYKATNWKINNSIKEIIYEPYFKRIKKIGC
jgi:hypothetical protein